MVYSIIDLPCDILSEIFRYLVEVCDYDNFNQYNLLKLSMPHVAHMYNQSLSIQKRTMKLNSHPHFRYKKTSVDLCGYVYEPFILEIYSGLIRELSIYNQTNRSKKSNRSNHTNPFHKTHNITFHPKSGIPIFYMKHMKSIIHSFCNMCDISNVTFSHLCCGGFGVVCNLRSSYIHHIA